jgi:hypothetical protein
MLKLRKKPQKFWKMYEQMETYKLQLEKSGIKDLLNIFSFV